jgi:hypothetical protein
MEERSPVDRLDEMMKFVLDELKQETLKNKENKFASQLYAKLQGKLSNFDSGNFAINS